MLATTLTVYFLLAFALGEPLSTVSWPGDLEIPYAIVLPSSV